MSALGTQPMCCADAQATQRGHGEVFWPTFPAQLSAESRRQPANMGVNKTWDDFTPTSESSNLTPDIVDQNQAMPNVLSLRHSKWLFLLFKDTKLWDHLLHSHK